MIRSSDTVPYHSQVREIRYVTAVRADRIPGNTRTALYIQVMPEPCATCCPPAATAPRGAVRRRLHQVSRQHGPSDTSLASIMRSLPLRQFYELRFPRVSKVHRPSERPWTDGVTLQEYQRIARAAVGRDRPGKAEDDWAKTIFRPDEPASPGVRCPQKRKQTEMLWIEKLEVADGKTRNGAGPSKRARLNTARARRNSSDIGNAENVAKCGEVAIGGNAPDAGAESLRGRLGVARLASVTNVAVVASSSPIQQLTAISVVSPPRVTPPTSYLAQDAPSVDKTQPRASPPRAPPPMATPPKPQLPQTPPPSIARRACQGPQPTLILKTEESNGHLSLGAQLAPPATLHRYLQDSVVLLARPHGSARPSWRAPSFSVIPRGNQVHTLEAVMIACGWDATPPCSWAKRGVVFVDASDESHTLLKGILAELAGQRTALLKRRSVAGLKPILVFDMKMLAYDALHETLSADEVESRAICCFG